MSTALRYRQPKLTAWAALTAAAVAVLLARVVPDAIEHRDQIHATGIEVTLCAAEAHRPSDGGTQTLQHLAHCTQGNNQIRHELGDELAALLVLALTATGAWHVNTNTGRRDRTSSREPSSQQHSNGRQG